MAKSSSAAAISQRSRGQANPIDLGVFSELTIRELKGRIGAMNTGQARPLSTNDGTGFAFQNVWFKLTVKVPFFIIFVKAVTRDARFIDLSFYNVNDKTRNLALPILRDPDVPFYWCHAASSQSDIYNLIEDEVSSSNIDKGYTSRLPLPPGTYLIKLSTQRWDAFNYKQYFIIETPVEENYLVLEGEEESYILLESSTEDQPIYLSDEIESLGASEIRQVRSHNLRRWENEWNRTYSQQAFPTVLTNYVTSVNTVVANPDWNLDQKSQYLKTVRP